MSSPSLEVSHKIDVYFKDNVDTATFALYMRRFLNTVVSKSLEVNDDVFTEEIATGYHYLNSFVEEIDPYLFKED
ncbi:MAG: hypothetical protein COB73_00840 [Flavobacteriaceae bacterium]|nr:MAG: hypothetical protein COB73_00840 [Flavobacteriaceae bacterium]